MASMAPPNSRISRPACVLLADHERSWLFLDRVNSRPVRRSNRAIAASVNVVSSSNICAASEADPPPLAEVAEQVDRSDRSLACELGSSGRVDVVAEMAR